MRSVATMIMLLNCGGSSDKKSLSDNSLSADQNRDLWNASNTTVTDQWAEPQQQSWQFVTLHTNLNSLFLRCDVFLTSTILTDKISIWIIMLARPSSLYCWTSQCLDFIVRFLDDPICKRFSAIIRQIDGLFFSRKVCRSNWFDVIYFRTWMIPVAMTWIGLVMR